MECNQPQKNEPASMTQTLQGAMWKQLLLRSSRENLTLQGQIREMLVSAILDGQLNPNEAVPSSRELAAELGVGRITVVLAYQQLADEGYLISRERKGHFVNPSILGERVRRGENARPSRAVEPTRWGPRFVQQPSLQRSIVKPANWQESPFPFLYGQFDESLFPTAAWRDCCQKALSVLGIREWAPDQITRDDESLAHQICTRVLPRRGVWARPDELIITVGAQHALYMVADLLMRESTRVAIEDPGYPDARNIFGIRTTQLEAVAIDDNGLIVNDRLRDFDYVYTTPSHQCPTGVTMPLQRRKELLRIANETNLVIIEDDFESENNFEGNPIPALKSLDQGNRVIYIGSLSKSMAPGLRIGYIVAAPELITELRALRRLMIRHPSTFIQRSLSLFISFGHNDAQLKRLADAQKERGALVLKALARHAPQCKVTPMSGGGSCWVQLPGNVPAAELAQRAAERGVLLEPGDVFFHAERPAGHFIRLGFQSINAKVIDLGIATLAEVIGQIEQRRHFDALS
jgi:GntR family transcriptional regulator/MocR family aminotransferase